MKVLLAADIFPPETGGPATYVVTLAGGLMKQGDSVCIVSLNPNSDTESPATHRMSHVIYHVSYRNKAIRYLQYLYLLLKHAKGMDVVYAMGPVNAGLPAFIAARLRHKRLVIKVVGDYAWEQGIQRFGISASIDEFQKMKNIPWKVKMLRAVQRYVCRHSDTVIVPSRYVKRLITGWGLDWHCVQVVYNAINWKVLDTLKHPVYPYKIVTVGRLVPWKGFATLIDLMSEILLKYPEAYLKIIGGGPLEGFLKEKIETLGLSGSVQLMGELDRGSVISEMYSANIFILNSGYEGLPHVLLEALEARIPILASDVGGNHEVIFPGKNGDLFPYDDKERIKKGIFEIFEGKKFEWDEMERQKFFEQFSLASMIGETRMCLQQICAR